MTDELMKGRCQFGCAKGECKRRPRCKAFEVLPYIATPAQTKGDDLVERLKPRHTADEPIARAVVSNDQVERRRAVEAFLIANNALKSDAASRIQSLTASNEALRDDVAHWRDTAHEQNGLAMGHETALQAAQAEIARMREALERIAFDGVTDRDALTKSAVEYMENGGKHPNDKTVAAATLASLSALTPKEPT